LDIAHNDVAEEVRYGKATSDGPPDYCGVDGLVRDEESETTVRETGEDDGSAEPEMDVGEPATVGRSVFNKAGVVVCAETGLDDCCDEDSHAEIVV
jgi:hypothetical protein